MTGVEAVSNGVKAFREPVVKSAQRALTAIIAILIVLLGGIAYLVRAYHIGATDPGTAGYQSVLSQLTAAVAGQGVFYYITMGSILLVLALSANTAFADFPRLCRAVAEDGYLPHGFASRGRRLVYSQGIWVLAVLCAAADLVWRGHGPPDSAVCRGRFPGVYAVPSRHGGSLETNRRQRIATQHVRQRPGLDGDGDNRHRGDRGQVRRRSLGNGVADSRHHDGDVCHPPALSSVEAEVADPRLWI